MYEYCPRCEANLTLQKGYSSELPYWDCRGCGERLYNPEIYVEDDITWVCDECRSMLNIQDGFTNDCGEWACAVCGHVNKIDESEIYLSEDEFRASLRDPYKGLSPEAVLALSAYEEVENINGREDIILVRHTSEDKDYNNCICSPRHETTQRDAQQETTNRESRYETTNRDGRRKTTNWDEQHQNTAESNCNNSEKFYVKKYLKDYNLSVYEYLLNNPIEHMPRLVEIHEGSNNLVVIEEYIAGRTLLNVVEEGDISACLCGQACDGSNSGMSELTWSAVEITKRLCRILMELHRTDNKKQAIVHRDIKPSNIIISDDGEVYLLDINVAKWADPEEIEDTRLYGTLYYAAPEQLGFGFSGSSEKSDIYALGILMNYMITGKLPKEEKAEEPIWTIIEKCISFEPTERYTAWELLGVLEEI